MAVVRNEFGTVCPPTHLTILLCESCGRSFLSSRDAIGHTPIISETAYTPCEAKSFQANMYDVSTVANAKKIVM